MAVPQGPGTAPAAARTRGESRVHLDPRGEVKTELLYKVVATSLDQNTELENRPSVE